MLVHSTIDLKRCLILDEKARDHVDAAYCNAWEKYLDIYVFLSQGDIEARKMIFGVEGVDEVRRQKLIELLDIDLDWRLNKVSDGQRRRVQICMGLLKPYKVRHQMC